MTLYNDRNQTKSETNQHKKNAIRLARVGVRSFPSIPHHKKQSTNKSLTTFGWLVPCFLGLSVSSRISKSTTRNVAKQNEVSVLTRSQSNYSIGGEGDEESALCREKRYATRFECTPSLRPYHTIRGVDDDAGQWPPFLGKPPAPPRDHYGQTTFV
jgi:hypothetical protein